MTTCFARAFEGFAKSAAEGVTKAVAIRRPLRSPAGASKSLSRASDSRTATATHTRSKCSTGRKRRTRPIAASPSTMRGPKRKSSITSSTVSRIQRSKLFSRGQLRFASCAWKFNVHAPFSWKKFSQAEKKFLFCVKEKLSSKEAFGRHTKEEETKSRSFPLRTRKSFFFSSRRKLAGGFSGTLMEKQGVYIEMLVAGSMCVMSKQRRRLIDRNSECRIKRAVVKCFFACFMFSTWILFLFRSRLGTQRLLGRRHRNSDDSARRRFTHRLPKGQVQILFLPRARPKLG